MRAFCKGILSVFVSSALFTACAFSVKENVRGTQNGLTSEDNLETRKPPPAGASSAGASSAGASTAGASTAGSVTPSNLASDIIGTWAQPCTTSDGEAWKTTVGFEGATHFYTSVKYSGPDCASEKMIIQGIMSFSGGVTVTSPAGAKTLDLVPSNVTITIKDTETLDELKFIGVCGLSSTLKLNEPIELTAQKCENDSFMLKAFAVIHTIYKVNGSKLNLGDCVEGGPEKYCTSAAKRPSGLEIESYTKI
jgi:hypothetical protein